MANERVIRFTTSTFDVTTERPNPINPIAGESLLKWLRERASAQFALSEPEAEDWGWYASLTHNGRAYMLGSSASDEEEGGEREWVLQIVKQRSFAERLLGRARLAEDDECAAYFERLIREETGFKRVCVDPQS